MSKSKTLLVDITHNETRAILIDENRIIGKSSALTTVDEPTLNVTVGVMNAIKQLESNEIKLTTKNGVTQSVNLLCSSNASGGLHMIITGVIRDISGESAQRAALGAGALLIDTFSKDDQRPPYKKIAEMRRTKPDILLMSGGTDGGATSQVLEMAEVIKKSDIKPRYGSEYRLPLIYAGNVSLQEEVDTVLGEDGYALKMVENVRPLINKENLGPARESIYDAYMEHVIIHSPGYDKLAEWTDTRIMPSQALVGRMLYTYAQQYGVNLIAVDIGGDTTDVYSVYNGVFNRSLNAGIGLTYGIGNIVKQSGIDNVLRWLPPSMDERSVRNSIGNMMIQPHTSYTQEEHWIRAAVAREAIKHGLEGHKAIAQRLKGVVTERTLGDMFEQALEPTLLNMMKTKVIIGKGEAFREQTIEDSTLMLLDSLQPEGVTKLYLDPENMAAPLGNLVESETQTALQLYTEALTYIGACIAPRGELREGSEALRLDFPEYQKKHTFKQGEITVIPIKTALPMEINITPNRLDIGAGRGKTVKQVINAGRLGLIVDTRGRPMNKYRQTVKLLPFEALGGDS